MKGLIKKDLLMCKNNLKIIAIVFIFMVGMLITGEANFSFFPTMMSVVTFMSTFSYDEYNKWNAYAITLPNGRKNVVLSKYIATIIICFATTMITVLLEMIFGYVTKNFDLQSIVSIIIGCFVATLIIMSILYPLIFKMGIEKGRIVLFVATFGIAGVVGVFAKIVSIEISVSIIHFLKSYAMLLAFAIPLVMLFISYQISQKIYLNKEF